MRRGSGELRLMPAALQAPPRAETMADINREPAHQPQPTGDHGKEKMKAVMNPAFLENLLMAASRAVAALPVVCHTNRCTVARPRAAAYGDLSVFFRRTSDRDESVTNRVADKVCDRINRQLSHHSRPMRFRRFDADAERLAHLLVRLALRQELQHFALARRQLSRRLESALAAARLKFQFVNIGGQPGTEKRLPA